MRQRLTSQHLRGSTGQALVVLALALPLFFSMCALVVDGANLMVHRRTMQNAADASALAAAQELAPAAAAAQACAGDASCLQGVRDTHATNVAAAAGAYSEQNGGPSTVHECSNAADTNCYTWPYSGSYDKVEVRMHRSVSGFFSGLAGVKKLSDVAARSVAFTSPVQSVAPDTVVPGTPEHVVYGLEDVGGTATPGHEPVTVAATPAVTEPGETLTTDTTYGLDE